MRRPSCCCAASTFRRTLQASLRTFTRDPSEEEDPDVGRIVCTSPETEEEVEPRPENRNSRSALVARLVPLAGLDAGHVRFRPERYISTTYLTIGIRSTSARADGLSVYGNAARR